MGAYKKRKPLKKRVYKKKAARKGGKIKVGMRDGRGRITKCYYRGR